MGYFDGKVSIHAVIAIQAVLLLSTLSTAKHPWNELKSKHFCLPSTYNIEITSEGCIPEMVTVNACLGVCPSYVKIISEEPYFKGDCSCCAAIESETIKFTLKKCKDPQKSVVFMQSAKKCSCLYKSCK